MTSPTIDDRLFAPEHVYTATKILEPAPYENIATTDLYGEGFA
jgi:hypothetical protein